jgi:predicted Ser/Thr protein kinase
MMLPRAAAIRGCSALLERSHGRVLECEFRRRIGQAKKNAAEAALKIWRHPSMKESLLATGSIIATAQKIYYKMRN